MKSVSKRRMWRSSRKLMSRPVNFSNQLGNRVWIKKFVHRPKLYSKIISVTVFEPGWNNYIVYLTAQIPATLAIVPCLHYMPLMSYSGQQRKMSSSGSEFFFLYTFQALHTATQPVFMATHRYSSEWDCMASMHSVSPSPSHILLGEQRHTGMGIIIIIIIIKNISLHRVACLELLVIKVGSLRNQTRALWLRARTFNHSSIDPPKISAYPLL